MSGPNPTLTKGLTAGGAITKHRILMFDSADGAVVHATAATDLGVGVAAEIGAASGDPIDVHMAGIVLVEAGGTIARGAKVTSGAAGVAVAAAPAQGVNNQIVGIAMVTMASGDIAPMLLAPSTMQGA
jgi:hypothetical protein